MTAWEILTGNSTLQSGTAWEHLNNQEGGGGVYDQLFMTPVDHLRVNIQEEPVNVFFNKMDLRMDLPKYVAESSAGNLDIKLEFLNEV